jgi:hypothetical protein
MKILSIHNNELITKLENIGSTPGASLVEIPKIIKKDASTSCFDLIMILIPAIKFLLRMLL